MTSLAVSPFTLPAALATADHIGTSTRTAAPLTWYPTNKPEQQAFLTTFRYFARLAAESRAVHAQATDSAASHVGWMREHGWDAELNHAHRPGDLFLGAALRIAADWSQPGTTYHDGTHDRAVLRHGVFCLYHRQAYANPLVRVDTRRQDYAFCFQQVSHAPTSTRELVELAHIMVITGTELSEQVVLDYPCVDLAARCSADHLVGLHSGSYTVDAACEHFRLELDEHGGTAAAAAEIRISRGFQLQAPRTVEITGPFIVAVTHASAPRAVMFAAYCDHDSWRRPTRNAVG